MTGCATAPRTLEPAPLARARPIKRQTLSVVVAVGDLLTLFEHVIFGLVVGNPGRHRGLLAVLGVVVGVLVVGVLILGVAAGARNHGCESYLPVPGTQTGGHRGRLAVRCIATSCLGGILPTSPDAAECGLMCRLAASIVARCGLMSPGICHRWLPVWLPASPP